MTDRYDTLAHWLAFDLETTRLQRRDAARRQLAALGRSAQIIVDAYVELWRTKFAPAFRVLAEAFRAQQTRADYVLMPGEGDQ